ncbi:MAG: hypothetical protein WC371_04485 [Parachlamydiales bacterium]|jgi:hypothetical protein
MMLSKKNSIFWSFAILVLLFGLFLPTFLSLPQVQRPLFDWLSRSQNLELKAEKAGFSWLGKQTFTKLSYASEEVVFQAAELEIKTPFWKLLTFNLNNLLQPKNHFQIAVKEGFLQMEKFKGAVLKQINGTCLWRQKKLTLDFQGATALGGSFLINLTQFKNEQKGFLDLKDFPSAFIEKAFGLEGLFSAFAGETFSLLSDFLINNRQSPLMIALHSRQAKAEAELFFQKDGLSLKKAARLGFFFDPGYLSSKAKKNWPFLSEIRSVTPAEITISPEQFFLSWPFELKQLKIKSAQFNLGQMKIKNRAGFEIFLGLLKNQLFFNLDQLDVWFAPAFFSFSGGRLNLSRLDFLLEKAFFFCAMGKIDFKVQMVDGWLGITAAALNRAFGLKNLPSDYILPLKVSGSWNKIHLESKQALQKITYLIARQSQKKNFLGPFLELLPVPEEERIFPPSLQPPPWR